MMQLLYLIAIICAFIYLAKTHYKKEEAKAKAEARMNRSSSKPKHRYRPGPDAEPGDIAFDNMMSLYIRKCFQDDPVIDWDYTWYKDYNPSCIHYMQITQAVNVIHKSGNIRTFYFDTKDVWATQEEAVETRRVPMDEAQVWIANVFNMKIFPHLKEMERASEGKGFTYSYNPTDGESFELLSAIRERIESQTSYRCSIENGSLVFGALPDAVF